MPTVQELERLEALIARLLPLAAKQRGELIEAGDWNTLVGTLIELTRATIAGDDSSVVPPHEHTDAVGIGWLDTKLRQLVTGGALKDPGVETEFRRVHRDVTSLTAKLDRANQEITAARNTLREVSERDLVRETTLTRLNRKVLGAADDREDIAGLRATLKTIETEVARAVDVGTRLEIDGAPIDIAGLVTRVGAVEELRDRLTRPSGELLDASEFERRLSEMQASLVTEDSLTEALADLRGGLRLGEDELQLFTDRARDAARETAVASIATLRAELSASIGTRFGDFERSIEETVSGATEDVADDVLSRARAEIASAFIDHDDGVRLELESTFDERLSAASDAMSSRIDALSGGIARAIETELATRVPALLRGLETRLGGLETSLTALDGREAAATAATSAQLTELSAAVRTEASARAQLRVDLTTRIDGVESAVDPRITAAVDAARTILRTDLEATATASRRDMETRLAAVAREAAATEVQVLSTSVRTDVQSLIRQQIDATMATVSESIASEVAGLQQRITGIVQAEVTRATAGIGDLVRGEFEAFRPELERVVDARVGVVVRPTPVSDPIGGGGRIVLRPGGGG